MTLLAQEKVGCFAFWYLKILSLAQTFDGVSLTKFSGFFVPPLRRCSANTGLTLFVCPELLLFSLFKRAFCEFAGNTNVRVWPQVAQFRLGGFRQL
jgi:hypothetical protein